jgi:hypothetical protein
LRRSPLNKYTKALACMKDQLPLEDAIDYINHNQARLLVEDFIKFKRDFSTLGNLLNPQAPNVSVYESTLIVAVKNYYRSRRTTILEATERVTKDIIELISAMVQLDTKQLKETDFETHMRALLTALINTSIPNLEDAVTAIAIDPLSGPEILKASTVVLTNWMQIKTMLNWRLIYPLESSIRREAKFGCVTSLQPKQPDLLDKPPLQFPKPDEDTDWGDPR